eukprot:TRINITY_DN5061_c0_g1_i1.p1 TRINITY_DN5061_c0_g1~~TRINITY_DN5061_c0_g1_i1.p1  ORF type:complete len:169 (+),score=19.01 TRINITY_DN5061_c0_g1_i1:20-526(+)
MCVIYVSLVHKGYKLVLITNRDEDLNRRDVKAHYWDPQNPNIFAGKDLSSKGTWGGISKQYCKFGFLTNFREIGNSIGPESRGSIVTKYLESDIAPQEYLNQVNQKKHCYSPFNVILGTADEVWYLGSHDPSGEPRCLSLDSKIYSVANGWLESNWFKQVYVYICKSY